MDAPVYAHFYVLLNSLSLSLSLSLGVSIFVHYKLCRFICAYIYIYMLLSLSFWCSWMVVLLSSTHVKLSLSLSLTLSLSLQSDGGLVIFWTQDGAHQDGRHQLHAAWLVQRHVRCFHAHTQRMDAHTTSTHTLCGLNYTRPGPCEMFPCTHPKNMHIHNELHAAWLVQRM
jgi:hypothetical protein